MGRFGIRTYAGNWAEPVAGVRPLLKKDKTRVSAAILAIVVTACVPGLSSFWLALPLLAIPLLVLAAARVPGSHTGVRVLAVVPFGFVAVLFTPWTMPEPREEVLGLSYSIPGLHFAVMVLAKLIAAALWLSYLTATTPVPRFLKVLRDLRVPGLLVDILEGTVRYLGVLAAEGKQMLLSCRLRATSTREGNAGIFTILRRRFARVGTLVAGLFLRTLRRAERCAEARASRELPEDDDGAGAGSVTNEDIKNEILVEGLSYRYPGATANALSGVTLNIPRGKRIAILGANGAGKTTLLLHLNGVLPVQSGRVLVGGLEVNPKHLRTIRGRVGMVFQNPDDQVFAATVFDDVRFGPEQAGHDEETCDRMARDALEAVGLWSQRESAPFSLSQGQRKRAAIAGVLAAGSNILLFDEPMASLDPAGKNEIQVLLNDLQAAGKTLVVATHDVDFAAAWADGVILMDSGQVMAVGSPALLVSETAMQVAGLALPLVSRPFEQLRPLLKRGGLGLDRLPVNTEEAFAWLKYHFVETARDNNGTPLPRIADKVPASEGHDPAIVSDD